MGNGQFQNQNRHVYRKFSVDSIIRNGQMQVQKRGFSIRVIGFIELKFGRVYLSAYLQFSI